MKKLFKTVVSKVFSFALIGVVVFASFGVGGWLHSYFSLSELPHRAARLYEYRSSFEDLTPEQQEEYANADAAMTNSKSREEYTKALAVWTKYRNLMMAKENELILSSKLPKEKVQSLVEEFSVKINREPIHDLFDECGSIWVEEGMHRFINKTGNHHPEYSYPVIFQDWMGAFSCDTYALHMIRREDPYEFADPHGAGDPLGLLIAQGYQPISSKEISENDLVFYFEYEKDPDFDESENPPGGLVRSSHYGVFKQGKVLSKQAFAGIAHHTLSAGGFPGWRYMVFRKDFNPEAPVPAIGSSDWIETDLCLTREGGQYKYQRVMGSEMLWQWSFSFIGVFLLLYFTPSKKEVVAVSETVA